VEVAATAAERAAGRDAAAAEDGAATDGGRDGRRNLLL